VLNRRRSALGFPGPVRGLRGAACRGLGIQPGDIRRPGHHLPGDRSPGLLPRGLDPRLGVGQCCQQRPDRFGTAGGAQPGSPPLVVGAAGLVVA
jgi:hypothetical protein